MPPWWKHLPTPLFIHTTSPLILLAITCRPLSPPTNGGVTYSTASPFTSGSVATYSCDRGYGLSMGDARSTCGGDGSSPNGVWSGVVPICEGCEMNVYPGL